jgi:high-affinity nickel-transport protein
MLTPEEWRRAGVLTGVILALHVIGFAMLFGLVVPQGFSLGAGGVFGVGLGLTAYTLGLRHAFDADHIAAIDNTTRKLMTDGQRPLSVGFFFSLGHSTIVFALALLFSIGVKALAGPVADDASTLHEITGLIGTSVSGTFLYVIGVINLLVLVSLVRVFLRMRRGDYDERELDEQLGARGPMMRLYGRLTRSIKKPWQMYPLGLLFGLGFDTATEIALLFLAAGAAFSGLPFYVILCLPILFAAGMSLLDTIDGAFMNFAYGWAFAKPVRRIYYNITITGLSVVVALVIGTFQLLSILGEELSLSGGFWDLVLGIDLSLVGYFVVGLFVVTWIVALAAWRFGRIEERWSLNVQPGGAAALDSTSAENEDVT